MSGLPVQGTWKIAVCLALLSIGPAWGQGILLPVDEKLPPLGIVYQRVNVTIREQAAVTRIEQEFSNPTSQQLEAIFLFPVPTGANVQDFAMWINGQRTKGEMVEAAQARQVYTDVVRRMRDPGLLERLGDQLFRVRVFPVPAQGRQKIELTYSEVVRKDAGLVEYVYPLRVGSRDVTTQEDFTIRVEIDGSAPIQNVYSPTHSVGISREGDRRAIVGFEQKQYALNMDFQLFWTTTDQDVGISSLLHRTSPGEDGYAIFLLSPRAELGAQQRVPRDIVFVLDTSGSMAGEKMEQGKAALLHCIKSLDAADRFGLVRFATTAESFDKSLLAVNDENRRRATEWVNGLSAAGGTAISDALGIAFSLQSTDARNFTIVFITDGQPTIGNTDPQAILEAVQKKNTAATRIFAFGVGDDVNAHLLDQLSDRTRGTTVYVRPKENLEAKVSSFFGKVSHPVLADLKLSIVNPKITIREMYPPQLPDLFHGGQIVVLARYAGDGASLVRLEGTLGSERKTFESEMTFAAEKRENEFVASLWAQRKIGYLLDQIRLSGENKELVDEVIALAKRFGIVTPYTSYLLVPDEKPPIVAPPTPPPAPPGPPMPVPRLSAARDGTSTLSVEAKGLNGDSLESLARAPAAGKAAVDAADVLSLFKDSDRSVLAAAETWRVGDQTYRNIQGVWIDQSYDPKAEIVRIVYLSEAYFQLLERFPELKKVFALGERVVWKSPSGKTVVVDGEGKETLTDDELKGLAKG